MKLAATLFSSIMLFSLNNQAHAACTRESGYLYVWASCVTDAISDGVCERRNGEDFELIFIISNVIYDSVDNRRFPEGQFFDAVEIQLGTIINGNASNCFRNEEDALDARDAMIADYRRSDYVIESVRLRDN